MCVRDALRCQNLHIFSPSARQNKMFLLFLRRRAFAVVVVVGPFADDGRCVLVQFFRLNSCNHSTCLSFVAFVSFAFVSRCTLCFSLFLFTVRRLQFAFYDETVERGNARYNFKRL